MRIKNVALIAISSAIMLSGCGSDPSISGTVERVAVQQGGINMAEGRYLKLSGSSDVYFCRLDTHTECAVVAVGDKVTLTVSINKTVTSILMK